MAEPKLTPEQWQDLTRRRQEGDYISTLAQDYGYSALYLKKRLSLEGILVAPSTKPRYDRPPKFPADTLILCDSHIPYHDADFINACFDLAKTWGLPNLLLAGDLVDFAALSVYVQKPEAKLEKELNELESFFKVADNYFQRILMLMGNHERRFFHYLKEQLPASYILRLVDEKKAEISPYGYVFVEGSWLVGHPRNVNVIPGRVPVFLSRKFPRYNVASGHGHLSGVAYCEDGLRLAVDIGSSCDPQRLDWIAERLNTRPAFASGALILKKSEGKVYPYWVNKNTDFRAMARLYAKD